jgi:serine/threonine protein kinase
MPKSIFIIFLRAIKLADPGDVMRPGDYDRFQLEVTILESQIHPSIIRMWNYGIPNYSETALAFPPWISLELIPGGDFQHYIRRPNGIPVNETLIIIYGVASALRVLHESGWVHRDIKPVNILLDSKCRPLITGFHYIGFISPENKGRRALVGSPCYRAPEIIGGNQKYTTKVDIYSLAMVIYQIRTKSEPSDVADEEGELGEDDFLRDLYRRMGDVNPEGRPTAGEVMREIEELAIGNLQGEELEEFQNYTELLRTDGLERTDAGSVVNLIEAARKFRRARECLGALLKTLGVGWTEVEILAKLVEIGGEKEGNLRELAQQVFESEPIK